MPGTIQISKLIPPIPILINVLCLNSSEEYHFLFCPHMWEFLCHLTRDSEIVKAIQFPDFIENRSLSLYLTLK